MSHPGDSADEGAGDEDAAGSDGDAPRLPCRLFLPVVPAARVIGKGGASIRAIREQSGAAVRVLQKELPAEMQRREDRIAEIAGSPAQVREALEMVLERVFDRSGLPEAAAGRSTRERALIVELVVPERSGSHFIGQKGERIRALIGETGCDLHVVKDPIEGLAEQKRIRITGNTLDEVTGAAWRMQEVLAELVVGGVLREEHFELREGAAAAGSRLPGGGGGGGGARFSAVGGQQRGAPPGGKEVPIRLLVPQDAAAWIVGKRGNKITRLRDFAKVQMNDADCPPFDDSDRVIEISNAGLEQRLRVVQMLLEDLGTRQEPAPEFRLLVPTENFGSLMGHRGETIRGIMQTTGARLQQHKAERNEDGSDYRLRLVEVRGDDRQCLEVTRLVHEAIEIRGRAGIDAAGLGGSVAGSGVGHGGGAAGILAGLGLGVASAAAPRAATADLDFGAGALGLGLGIGGGGTGALSGLLSSFAGPDYAVGSAAGAADGAGGAPLALQLAMPSEEVARLLASDSSGIAWRAGVKLSVGKGAGGIAILEVVGPAVANSVACYLIQDRLYMMH